MKRLLTIACFFAIACNTAEKKDSALTPGVYKMLSQSIKSSSVDTTYLSREQLKIYTGEYMMYADFITVDSISSFGIGTYNADKDTVTENVIYSADDSVKIDTLHSFSLIINKTDSGYNQLITDMGTAGHKITLRENYASIGTPEKTPLDGVWKELKSFVVKGSDTTKYNTTQYKAYYGGHFIWGHTFADSAKKIHTGMGFGKFAITDKNKLIEYCTTSSYSWNRGRNITLDYEMNGDDEFKQTITYPDKSKTVEIYQRMKQP